MSLMSMFPPGLKPIPEREITVEELVEMIRRPAPEVARTLEAARAALAAGDRDRYDDIKKRLPAATFAGTFERRRNDALKVHSGLMPIDLDHLDPEQLAAAQEQLRSDPYVIFLYISPSGQGLKGAIRLDCQPADDSEHKVAFESVRDYLATTHGLVLDPACKDVARLGFISDGDCFHNPDAIPFAVQAWVKVEPVQPLAPAPAELPPEIISLAGTYPPNDSGRARRFVDRYLNDIKFVPERGVWFTWTNDRWQMDRDGAILRLAVELGNEMLIGVAQAGVSSDADFAARKGFAKEALECGDRRNIQDFLELARVDARVLLSHEMLDSDPWLVAANNAVIDLRTGVIRSFTREDFTSRELGCDADPAASCPRWRQFMEEVFPDPDVRHFIHKSVGYTLTGDIREQVFFFLYGQGSNGKSKFIEAMEEVLGSYGVRAGKGIVAASDRGKYPKEEVAELAGARLAAATETAEGERMAEQVIKDLTGGDSLRGEFKYQHGFRFKPVCKLWIYGNHKPEIGGTDDGIWRRVRLVPFTQKFEGACADLDLSSKLLAEAPGILNWMIEGCLLWQREGLEAPEAVCQAVCEYRTEEDAIGGFLGECVDQSSVSDTTHSALFKRYQDYCRDGGIRYPLTTRKLATKLRARGWQAFVNGHGAMAWRGIAIKRGVYR